MRLDELKHFDKTVAPNQPVLVHFERWELKALIELIEASKHACEIRFEPNDDHERGALYRLDAAVEYFLE